VCELLKVQMLSYFIIIVYLFSFDLDLYKYIRGIYINYIFIFSSNFNILSCNS